jgi:hypothetical protein
MPFASLNLTAAKLDLFFGGSNVGPRAVIWPREKISADAE